MAVTPVTEKGTYFGFENLEDLTTHLLGLKTWSINFFFAIGAGVTSFITGFIWESSASIYTLWMLMLLDWILGSYNAAQQKAFSSRRFPRMIVYWFLTSCMIAISWWLAKASILFYFLPSIVYGGFCSVYFISLVENFAVLGVLPQALYKIIEKRFGLKALSKRIDEKMNQKKD